MKYDENAKSYQDLRERLTDDLPNHAHTSVLKIFMIK